MSNIDTIAYAKAHRTFTASNVSAKIIAVVGTAMTGLVVYNPVGSNKYMALTSAGFTLTTALGSISSIGIAISPNQPIIPSSLTVGSAVVKSSTGDASAQSVAEAWDTATLGVACVTVLWFAGTNWLTGGSGQFPYNFYINLDGYLGLMPGAAVCFSAIASTIPTGMGHFSWIETDLP